MRENTAHLCYQCGAGTGTRQFQWCGDDGLGSQDWRAVCDPCLSAYIGQVFTPHAGDVYQDRSGRFVVIATHQSTQRCYVFRSVQDWRAAVARGLVG